ncbi:MAG: sulfotransferase [Pseudomonadales bacterium]
MNKSLRQLLPQAQQRFVAGDLAQAQALYQRVLDQHPGQAEALQGLLSIALRQGQSAAAEGYLVQLVALHPGEPAFTDYLANLLQQRGAIDEATAHYERLLERIDNPAVSHFNFALLLRNAGRTDAALEQYAAALRHNIDGPEEVHSNISNIYGERGQHVEAEASLQQALALNADYLPALYNYALLCEECDRWPEAQGLLERMIALDPDHVDAHVRLAQGQPAERAAPELVPALQRLLRSNAGQPLAQESLYYALGKSADDVGDYAAAADHYRQANRLSIARVGSYDARSLEQLTQRLCDTAALPAAQRSSSGQPIFICGMFRSGSTLLEQMLAAHPQLEAGGELNYLQQQWPASRWLASVGAARETLLTDFVDGYLSELGRLFPNAAADAIINKQPENLLQVPLICRAFSGAKVLVTDRALLDNVLAVYFQQLSPRYGYANRLQDIEHYYQQCQRLLARWLECFPDNIRVVSYEALVQSPEKTLRPVLEFLGLPWDGRCLRFFEVDNRVRTASVWQVRQPLHSRSVGRADHYRELLAPLRE